MHGLFLFTSSNYLLQLDWIFLNHHLLLKTRQNSNKNKFINPYKHENFDKRNRLCMTPLVTKKEGKNVYNFPCFAH